MKFETYIKQIDGQLELDNRYVSEEDFKRYFGAEGFDMLNFIKLGIRNWLETLSIEDVDTTNHETVTLFHGTTSAHLNSILVSGILPSNETDNANWDKDTDGYDIASAKNVTYLTNKFHYMYAFLTNDKYREAKGLSPDFWQDYDSVPCYFEIDIPKHLLVPDEDNVHSSYFAQKLKSAIKKGTPIEVTWEESLSQYGTVGVLGGVKREYIKSVTLLGDRPFYLKHHRLALSQYAKEVAKWGQGKGKGKLKNNDMIILESECALNSTLMMNQIPKGHIITGFRYNEERDNLDFIINKIVK